MNNNQRDPDSVQTQLFIYNCTLCASFVILYYDYFLTVQDEYDRYWLSARKFTFGWTLFFINRYVVILGNIPVMYLYFWSGSEPDRLQRCLTIGDYHEFLIVVSQVVIGSIVILRTRAIYGRSRRILFLLVVVAVAVTAYGMRSILLEKVDIYSKSDLTSSGCLLPLSNDGARGMYFLSTPHYYDSLRLQFLFLLGLAEAWSGHVCFDSLVFFLTLYKSLTSKRAGFSILTVMLRDGTIYFGVMVLASISVILSFELYPDYLKGMTSTATNVLSSTMISRLMLNLRDPLLSTEHDARQREEIILSNLVFEAGAAASTSPSNKSLSDEEWTGSGDIHSTGGIYILEDLSMARGTHPNKADTFQSVEQLV
ncbi:hypothetical protein GALMADRAFT_154408 [Galerina marginata CBS 339.88]|uniref:DUF6533 domain-containing protein n=1 Tax=Galerina marginata (strain CBS 339.88) TaxID=685588 RepID=A0A067TB23_GALM3|nr:hypothetical protein GALMADRAFT_154408 [Galerina marginata CBS 339.88]